MSLLQKVYYMWWCCLDIVKLGYYVPLWWKEVQLSIVPGRYDLFSHLLDDQDLTGVHASKAFKLQANLH